MERFFGLLGLTIAISITAMPVAGDGLTQASTWSGEFVSGEGVTRRELIVNAWYPTREPEGPWSMILLATGRGVSSSSYAKIAEFLVGHGFVVVAVDSPGSGRQVFSDGRVVPPDPALAPPPGLMAGPYIEVDRFFASAATAGAGDLAFILDRIAEARAGGDIPFAGRVDTDRVGLLGHSLGGRIAGAFAARDARAAAWTGVEGLAPRAARRHGLGIPALAILSEGVWPYAIGNVRELAWCAQKPTYLMKMAGIEHNTITDSESDGTMTPGQLRLADTIRRFFQHHMIDTTSPLEDWPEGVSVERHVAPSGEGPPGLSCNA